MSITQDRVLEFMKAYYNAFSYDPKALYKFYSDDSFIYRQNLDSKLGKPFSEMKELLNVEMSAGTRISLTNYSIIRPDEDSVNLTVNGTMVSNEEKKYFTQMFTLKYREEITWIVADSLLIQSLDIEKSNEDLVVLKRIKYY